MLLLHENEIRRLALVMAKAQPCTEAHLVAVLKWANRTRIEAQVVDMAIQRQVGLSPARQWGGDGAPRGVGTSVADVLSQRRGEGYRCWCDEAATNGVPDCSMTCIAVASRHRKIIDADLDSYYNGSE